MAMTFGKRLRIMRAVRSVTQQDLGYACGIPRIKIIAAEAGWLPPEDMQAKLRYALDWTELDDATMEALYHG